MYYDLDGVLCDFVSHFFDYLSLPNHEPEIWDDPRIIDNFHKIKNDYIFWLSIPPLIDSIPIKPTAYVTNRPIPSHISADWLWRHGFPYAPVATLKNKAEIIPAGSKMVDDAPHNYEELTAAGVHCYLLDKPYNRHIQTDKRIYSLAEIQ
jgi:hypothetical protein